MTVPPTQLIRQEHHLYTNKVIKRSVRAIGFTVAVCAGVATANPAWSATPATIDPVALGSGGGAFCDASRAGLKDTLKADLSTAMATHDTNKIKAFYEMQAAQIPKLIALAPSSIKDAVVLTMKPSKIMADAMKKAGYEPTKLDRTAFSALSTPSAADKAATATVNAYFKDTCHMDMLKAFGIAAPPTKATPTTRKK